MKTNVTKLEGLALDWIVGKLEEERDRCLTVFRKEFAVPRVEREVEFDSAPNFEWWSPSRIWQQGGPIIEEAGILLRPIRSPGHSMDGLWLAMLDGTNTGSMVHWFCKNFEHPHSYLSGPTPLVAAMRCYVRSKLGHEVEIPEEFLR